MEEVADIVINVWSWKQPKPAQHLIAGKQRARLTETNVIAIFQSKSSGAQATSIGKAFGVSEKAIRDIWKGRTWAKETWHLEPSRLLETKQIGRPRGRKDSMPRKRKIVVDELISPDSIGSSFVHPYFRQQSSRYNLNDITDHDLIRQFCITKPVDGYAQEHETSIDEELCQWDKSIWCESDPFQQDWKPIHCTF